MTPECLTWESGWVVVGRRERKRKNACVSLSVFVGTCVHVHECVSAESSTFSIAVEVTMDHRHRFPAERWIYGLQFRRKFQAGDRHLRVIRV